MCAAPSTWDGWPSRKRLDEWGARNMTISVIAGNEGALRFYRREGASDYEQTLIMPVRQP